MAILRHIGHQGNFGKLNLNVLNSLDFSFLTILTHEALDLLCSGNYFDEVSQEILQIRYIFNSSLPLRTIVDNSWAVTAENSPLHVASSRTRTGNLSFLSTSY